MAGLLRRHVRSRRPHARNIWQRAIGRICRNGDPFVKTLRVVERRAADHAFAAGRYPDQYCAAGQPANATSGRRPRRCPQMPAAGCGEGAGQQSRARRDEPQRRRRAAQRDSGQPHVRRPSAWKKASAVAMSSALPGNAGPSRCPPVVNARDGEAALGEAPCPMRRVNHDRPVSSRHLTPRAPADAEEEQRKVEVRQERRRIRATKPQRPLHRPSPVHARNTAAARQSLRHRGGPRCLVEQYRCWSAQVGEGCRSSARGGPDETVTQRATRWQATRILSGHAPSRGAKRRRADAW